MKMTYRTLPYSEDDDVQESEGGFTESGESPKSNHQSRTQWDDNCPWSEWYSAEDPLRGNGVAEEINNCIFYYQIWSELIRGSDIRPI